MEVILNGEKKEIAENISVKKLLAALGIKTEQVAVELNLTIVPKTEYENKIIKAGDKIEIISFVGGG
ncbi:MAG: sulfur carrier protein ThiS [Planctomycetes bacterium]|nr:sulfur carrier protein ThiS [Planctomycetota bacterium]